MGVVHKLCLAFAFCVASTFWAHAAVAEARVAAKPDDAPATTPQVPELTQHPAAESGQAEGLVHLDVVVTGKTGRPIPGLESKDLTLLDNGRPNRILSFQAFDGLSAKPDPPVEVILLIDTLNLPANLASLEREEVGRFLRQNGGHLAQPVSIFQLSEAGLWAVAQDSDDGNSLAAEMDHNRDLSSIRHSADSQRGEPLNSMTFEEPPGLSALKALGELGAAASRKPGRKLLLWVGPGWGVGSGAYLEGKESKQHLFDTIYWFSTLLREARIVLYSFSVGETDSRPSLYAGFLKGVQSVREANFMNL